jgi:hypothetical protein
MPDRVGRTSSKGMTPSLKAKSERFDAPFPYLNKGCDMEHVYAILSLITSQYRPAVETAFVKSSKS